MALRGVVRCRAGAVTRTGVWYGPGSAKRHEECRIASGTPQSACGRIALGLNYFIAGGFAAEASNEDRDHRRRTGRPLRRDFAEETATAGRHYGVRAQPRR